MAEQLYKVGEEAIWADRDVKGMVIAVEEIDGRYMYTFVWQGHFEYGVGAHQLKKLVKEEPAPAPAPEELGAIPGIPTFSYADDLAELEARASDAPPTPPVTPGLPPIPQIPYEEDMKEIRRLLAEAADRAGDVRQMIPVAAPTSVVLEVGGMEIVIESETAVSVRVNEA